MRARKSRGNAVIFGKVEFLEKHHLKVVLSNHHYNDCDGAKSKA